MPTGVYERTEEMRLNRLGRPSGMLGKYHSKKTRLKMSKTRSGENNAMFGRNHTKEAKEKMRLARLKNPNKYWLGKKRSQENIEKNRITHLGKYQTEETKEKIRKNLLGHTVSEETRKKLSEARKGKYVGKNSPHWQGGISFEPYIPEFNKQLKELIRQRDNYKCQLCGMPEIENIRKLDIHHIDYIKKNCLPYNLTAL